MVNGRLVRMTRKDRSISINEPLEAISALRHFRGRLYVVFVFAGASPTWYDIVVEPHPALPVTTSVDQGFQAVMDEIVRDQVDLALLAISLRQQIDTALERRDEAEFRRCASRYSAVMSRCLWEF